MHKNGNKLHEKSETQLIPFNLKDDLGSELFHNSILHFANFSNIVCLFGDKQTKVLLNY